MEVGPDNTWCVGQEEDGRQREETDQGNDPTAGTVADRGRPPQT